MESQNERILDQPEPTAPSQQARLPQATLVFTIGLLAILLPAGLGFPAAVFALMKGQKGATEKQLHPGKYTRGSITLLNTGRILALFALLLKAMTLLPIVLHELNDSLL